MVWMMLKERSEMQAAVEEKTKVMKRLEVSIMIMFAVCLYIHKDVYVYMCS